jgi:membrane-associated HD superfamily phosphohydrolase
MEHPRLHKYWKVFATFSLTCFAWIFFRAANVSDAFYIIGHLTTGWDKVFSLAGLNSVISGLGTSRMELLIGVLSIAFLLAVHLVQRHGSIRHMLVDKPVWLRWAIYLGVIWGILAFGVFGRNQFIYFQF